MDLPTKRLETIRNKLIPLPILTARLAYLKANDFILLSSINTYFLSVNIGNTTLFITVSSLEISNYFVTFFSNNECYSK